MARFPTRRTTNIPSNIGNLETVVSIDTQTRVGSVAGVSLSNQTQTIGDIIRDVNIQPFMRSRIIRVSARGMKPVSRLYAFFDGTNVSAYITPTNSSFVPTAAEGSTLTTDANGNAYALFRIPNQDSIRFRVGEKVFRLTDSPTNDFNAGLVTTSGQATYASQGLITQTQDAIISTTVPQITPNTLPPTPTIQELNPVISGNFFDALNFNFSDPIAQSFTVDTKTFGRVSSSGAFITKVDLYFAEKDASLPVIIELRELDPISGYPTPKVLPYGRAVVESSMVNVSDDSSKPTPVYFPCPVYVQDGKSYALVIIPGGGSPNYRVWISRLGEDDKLTQNRITSQPAAGVLFASSNDRTYTALQEEDLKFRLYFANFNVQPSGQLIMKNEQKDYLKLSSLSDAGGFPTVGEIVHGETFLKGTFASTQTITPLSQTYYVQEMDGSASGILTHYDQLNGEARVRDVTLNAKFTGGRPVRIRLSSPTGTIVGNSTGGLTWATYPTGRVAFYDSKTQTDPYLHLTNLSSANSGPSTGASPQNRTFESGRYIRGQTGGVTALASEVGSLKADLINIKGDFITPSNTSVIPYGKFASSTSTRDANFIRININSDTEFAARRFVHSRSIESNTALSSSTMKNGSVEIKFDLQTNNRYASPVFDTTRISATTVETLLNNDSTGEAATVAGGNARAKYITRKVILAEGQDAEDLRIYIDAYNPPGTDVKVYYKVLHAEDSDTFAMARWIEMDRLTATTEVSASEDKQDFRELQFGVPPYPTGAGSYHSGMFANSNPSDILCYRNSRGAFYEGFKYFSIKVVLIGTNTTNPPRIRNFRAIALQK